MKATVGKRELSLTPRPIAKLPKRNPLTIKVNGTPVEARWTSNKAWCGLDEKFLEYVWFPLDEKRCCFVTLAYGELATSLEGKNFVVSEGSVKPEPRVTKFVERETARIGAFKETWAANRSK